MTSKIMYIPNHNDKRFYLSIVVLVGIIIVIITKRVRSCSSIANPHSNANRFFLKIFYPTDKFEWNTYRLYIFSLNSWKSLLLQFGLSLFSSSVLFTSLKLGAFAAHLSAAAEAAG